MSSYRLLRRLAGPTHLYESWAGQGASGERVMVKRLGPWCKDTALLERLKAVAHVWDQRPAGLTGFVELAEGDTQCVVERWFDGDSMRSALLVLTQRQVRPQLPQVVSLVVKAAQAVTALHDYGTGTVHGDVSASSLLFDAQGDVLLTDFGLARCIGLMGANGPARVESYSVAPEQLADGKVVQASDVFRLGQLLYELVMGRPLFPVREWKASAEQARGYAGLTAQHLPHVPEPFASLLLKSLAKDPAERPTAAVFCDVLTRHAATLGCNVDAQVADVFKLAFGAEGKPFPSEGAEAVDLTLTSKTTGATNLARIATRKVSAADLEAERAAQEAAEAAKRPPPTADDILRVALQASGHLKPDMYEQAKAYALEEKVSLARALIVLGSIDEEVVLEAQSQQAGLGFMSSDTLSGMPVPTEAIALLPETDAEALCAVPLSLDDSQVTVALSDPTSPALARAVAKACGVEQVTVIVATESAVRRTIGRFYRGEDGGELPSWLESPSAGRVSVPVEDKGPGGSKRAIELTFDTPPPMKAEHLFDPSVPRGSPPRASRKSSVMMPMEYDLVELSSPSRAGPVSPPTTAKAPLMSPPSRVITRPNPPVSPPMPAMPPRVAPPPVSPPPPPPAVEAKPVVPAPPPPPPASPAGLRAPASPPVTVEEPEPAPAPPPVAPPAAAPLAAELLSVTAWPVVRALLSARGGEEAAALVDLATSVLGRLQPTQEQVGALRFAALAVTTHNALEGRQPWDAPSPDAFRAWAGGAWAHLEPVIGAWLFGRTATEPSASVFSVAFMLASVAGVARPAVDDAAFLAIRSRLRGTPGVVEALEAELAQPR